MFHYRLKIAYKGTGYRGWQAQSKHGHDGDRSPEGFLPTVQGTIYQVLQRISKYQDCTISGTSRTDAGVHARGQVGKVSIPVDVHPDKLLLGMNSLLPADIRVLACESCAADFNPKTQPSVKRYHYYFTNEPVPSPLLGDVVAHIPFELDRERMAQAARLFVGTHDFYNFYCRSSLAATTTRTVLCCEIFEAEMLGERVWYMEIRGDGFLKQMVRYIAGTLFAVGKGSVELGQVAAYLETHHEEKLWPKAKAHGLHLMAAV